ncbi:GntR family transcriptional regulator [Puniceibacterium sediminis]|uniref:Transcriptional regulator, GntR family n=1 Tax=Puniceibacterium sediminis TaxID=1608407 RepID=A0A238Y9G6_9RHOB|nr:GntR family transcriptional regulator [Puniceibacterium sediminis]SNR67670.1 transcriptional regulator, GntR family [Puniceibacterium sediminis]
MSRHEKRAHAEKEPTAVGVTARVRAYDGIRAAILSGVFAPGRFIEEAIACEMTGVSRSPVREALNRLAAEGFVELHPRRGAMVRLLSADEFEDLCEVRHMIESHAVRRICRDARPVPDGLEELCEAQTQLSEDDFLSSVEINRQFHQAIVAASGNTVLVQVFDNLQANLTRVAMLSLKLGVGQNDVIVKEHRELIAALIAHDEDRALSILDRHLVGMPRLKSYLPT